MAPDASDTTNPAMDPQPQTGSTPASEGDRRVFPRHRSVRPAKLSLAGAGPFAPAQTIDYSAGGTLLDVHAPRPISPGQRVEVWIEFKAIGVVPRNALHAGSVVRSSGLGSGTGSAGSRQRVAVRFDRVLNRAGD
jgi:hypothetical protein